MTTGACMVAGCAALLWAAAAFAQPCLGDFNHDSKVTINEIIVSVNNALNGCPGSGQRFVDNGDGTVTDTKTNLMWEKKEYLDGTADPINPHDADNLYQWSSTGTAPDGAAFTDFLVRLNACVSADGSALTGGFAGQCDWRLPTIAELRTILLAPCATRPCIDPIFGPTQAFHYWSATTDSSSSLLAWFVDFFNGGVFDNGKPNLDYVRAVRGGL